jgi:hypothetical protein
MALGMLDLIAPYFSAEVDLGEEIHDALAILHVDEYDTAWPTNYSSLQLQSV